MLWIGFITLAIAALWIIWKLYVAYHSEGGTVMVVVYDAALYPPILIAIGLYLVLPRYKMALPVWGYIVIWAITTAVVIGAIRLMEEIGDRPL